MQNTTRIDASKSHEPAKDRDNETSSGVLERNEVDEEDSPGLSTTKRSMNG